MNQSTWQQVLPVLCSILVIVAIAVLRNVSKTFAAIAATMPLTIPLALWIMAASGTTQSDLVEFSGSLVAGVGATVVFTIALWLAARAGCGWIAMLAAGYAAYALVLGIAFVVRATL